VATLTVHDAAFATLDTLTLYELLKLRTDVFVVEQRCPYAELDGRDLEPGTRHMWISEPEVVAYLRILAEPDGSARIGRVCTARYARGRGLSARLVSAALARAGGHECVLDAQSYLVAFYQRFQFEPSGPQFDLDGIPHVPMRRVKAAPTTGIH
jgi:ElaA protein